MYLSAVMPCGTRYAFASERRGSSRGSGARPRRRRARLERRPRIPYEALRLAADGQERADRLVRNVAATAEHETLAYDAPTPNETIPAGPTSAMTGASGRRFAA